ncbi:hypothetical protein Tco_0875909 [Tanacetum coccineum]|uniref:Uncharacterized protein n=1 Tax=Tanacetum coccineum TaxID=301880 RepID=A0ABQ5BTT9_9ASTR
MPYDSPLHVVHSHGSTDGSMQQHDLTVLVTKLNDRIDGLEKDLQQTKKTYSTALTKLVLRVKKLKYKLKSGKARKMAKIVLSDGEEIAEDSSKQGRKISQIDEDPTISKYKEEDVHGEATSKFSTASPPKVSTVVPHVYTRRSAKDKGKAIMEEPATPKKVKKRTQVQLSMDEELARKIEEEERIRLMREQESKSFAKKKRKERLNLDSRNQGGYKERYFKKMSYDDIRPIFERLLELEEKHCKKKASDNQGQDRLKDRRKRKKQLIMRKKKEEKDELRMWLTVVLDEEEFVDPEILHTKFPIVDWESQSLGNMHVYKIIRAYGNTSYHKTFESMLKSFDRHDLEVLHRLVMERFQDNTPEGYNLMLWGDLKILVDPEQDDDIWKNQNQWKIISWKLYETCGVHTLMVDGTLMTIHMFVEKKYPLTKETLQKMLNWKLEAEIESSMAFELLKFIKTQIEEQ